LLIGTMDFGLL